MDENEIEQFIKNLDINSEDMCVFPEQQTPECCDCYTCRVAYFNIIREELRNGIIRT